MNILPEWRDGTGGCMNRLSVTCLRIKNILGGNGQYVFVNSVPKSGLTILRNSLLELTWYRLIKITNRTYICLVL